MFKQFIKSKLNLSNINDLVLCEREYNDGLFGCMSNDQDKFLGLTLAPGVESGKKHKDAHLEIGQALNSFDESSNMQGVISANGPLGFLVGMNQDEESGSLGAHNLLGYCAIKDKKDMTEYQRRLTDYFEQVRNANPAHFKGQNKIHFSEIFRFRGILGQGSYGVVMIVQDKIPYQLQKLKSGGVHSLQLQN